MNTPTTTDMKLAPPGAGLPFPESWIARILFRLASCRGDKESLIARFQNERDRISTLIRELNTEDLSKRVLIKRPRGLEDSSRNWSILMTLDHLRIVHVAFSGVLKSLAHERVPKGQVSTAAVKPREDVTEAVIAEYEASCDLLMKTISQITNFKTQAKFPHPWFGPMNAHDWLALCGMHLGIHRVQIERILSGMRHETH